MPSIQRYAARHTDFVLSACCDANAELAQAFAQDYAIPRWYPDVDAMIDAEAPDAAVCLVSATVNHIVGGHLLQRGIPTLLEKPPGRSPEELAYLVDKQRASGTTHMVAFNRRFMPIYDRVKELLGDEPLRYLDYTMYRVRRHEPFFETTAIHAIDAVQHLTGSAYLCLNIEYQSLPHHGEGVVNMFLTGEMQNGAAVTVRIVVSTGDIREGCEAHTDTRIITTRTAFLGRAAGLGGLQVHENGRQTLSLSGMDIDPTGQDYVSNGFYREHEVFFDCLARGVTPPSQLSHVAQSVALCDALKRRDAAFTSV